MNTERNYILEFITMWIKVLIVYLIAGYLGTVLSEGISFDKDIAWMGAAIVFGLTFFNRVIPFNLFGNHDAVIVFWILKIIISMIIGIITFPVVNGYYLVNIMIYIIRSIRKKIK